MPPLLLYSEKKLLNLIESCYRWVAHTVEFAVSSVQRKSSKKLN
jgi:hypothetical protein